MAQIVAEMNESISTHVAEIALEIHADLVENPPTGTPIDTGWASVNWWMKTGSAPTGNDGPSGNVASRQAGQQAGIAELASYRIGSGQSVWITNGVPYIGRLNDGSSQQAPAGFVETAIKSVLDKNKRKVLS
ncbi:hypothetical protein ACR2VJ_27540 [Klebsiella pneumoniae]